MPALACGLLWAALVVWLVLRAVRQSVRYRPAQAPGLGGWQAPSVAVIVPARNESRNIGPCLAALSAQRALGPEFSVTVVDDNSRDGTDGLVRRHAASDPSVRLISAGPLPPGWMGKPHACWRGALASDAAWLCFIDADVRAAPTLLATALRVAEAERIDLLSLMPFQEMGGFWERLVLPAGLLMIACAKDLGAANTDGSPEATANGQFMLMRRDAYFAIGGHAAVQGEVCEDKALAALAKRAGHSMRLMNGERLARVRMYDGLRALWAGFGKNAVEIMGGARSTLAVACAGLAVSWLVPLLPLVLALSTLYHPDAAHWVGLGLALAGALAVVGMQIGTLRHFRVPLVFTVLFPLAFLVAALLAVHSVALRRRGFVRWKGRSYAAGGDGTTGKA